MNDELGVIAVYMAAQMNHNPFTEPGRRIKELLTLGERCISEWKKAPWWLRTIGFNARQCADLSISGFVAACIIWKKQVDYEQPWDHKPIIERNKTFWSQSTGSHVWHVYGDTAYFFDVWSNVHYGFVGRALGFGLDALLDGAGLAQAYKDTRVPFRLWELRAYDRPEDRNSIKLGWDLFHQRSIEPGALVQAIVGARGITRCAPRDVPRPTGSPTAGTK